MLFRSGLVLDSADVLSRASRGEIEKQLEGFRSERVDARLITIPRLDYGVSLDQLGQELVQQWTASAEATSGAATSQDPLLLVLVDAQTKAAAVVASEPLQRQLPAELLRSTARTTMAIPLREGNRYRQASLDGLTRLATVLRGGEDPGEPEVADEAVAKAPPDGYIILVADLGTFTSGPAVTPNLPFDPLADFTYHIMQWRMPPGGTGGGTGSLTGADLKVLGIPSEDEYVAMYCRRTGRSGIDNLDFYFAYNFFRIACILQGIMGRVRDGTAASAHATTMAAAVRPLGDLGWEYAKRAGARE